MVGKQEVIPGPNTKSQPTPGPEKSARSESVGHLIAPLMYD